MFVSVILDPGSTESARSMVNILSQFGFRKVQRSLWENMNLNEVDLSAVKKDLDRVTDYYDTIRIYQFPIDGMFVITELKEKKWKRCQMKAQPAASAQQNPAQQGSAQQKSPSPRPQQGTNRR